MSAGGDFGNPLRKFKLVFLGEQSGECASPPHRPSAALLASEAPRRPTPALRLLLAPSSVGVPAPPPGPLGPPCPPSPHPAQPSCSTSLSSSALRGLLHPCRLSGAPPLFLALFPVPTGTASLVPHREAPPLWGIGPSSTLAERGWDLGVVFP